MAALAGALAASLTTMVGNLTLGRKKYAGVEAEVKDIIAAVEPEIARFHEDIERDARAYQAVMEAFKLPKETDRERSERDAAIERATAGAIEVPMQVGMRALSILPAIERIVAIGNTNAVTDAAMAALCCQTAIVGANLNVMVNLSGLKDRRLADTLANEMRQATAIAMKSADKIVSDTYTKLSKQ